MILKAVFRALQRLLTPQYRTMLWKSLGVTLLVIVILYLLVRQFFLNYIWPWLANFMPNLPDWAGWLGITAIIVFSLGLAVLMALLVAPITAMIGGLFMDDAAAIIERDDFPNDIAGVEMPFMRALAISLKFLGLSILGNLLALMLFFVPGVNFFAFYAINGYLLGREYFEFAACRFRSEKAAHEFYRQNAWTVFGGGLCIALFVSIPILNLLTPLFAAAMMTYLHKSLSYKMTSI